MGRKIKPYECRMCGEECPEKFPVASKSLCSKCYRQGRLQYQREYYQEWYARNGRKRNSNYSDIIVIWQKNHPEAVDAKAKLKNAIEGGLISKPERCVLCGKKGRINGHHEDYNLPYDVMWVCSSCHKLIHLHGGLDKM